MNRTLSFVLASAIATFAAGCAPAEDDGAASQEAAQTSAWRTTTIGDRPGQDLGDTERVAAVADSRGLRHAVYLGRDRKVHYVDPAGTETVIDGDYALHNVIAVDAANEPHIAFSSRDGIIHARRSNGAWVKESLGIHGWVDAIAVDPQGTVHIASNTTEQRATHSTKRSTQGVFEHTDVPGRLEREIGFGAFAFAVDRSGTAYMLLSSFESIEVAPRVSRSGPTHTYYAKRPSGGAFTVEMLPLGASAGSLVVDETGVVHVVFARSAAAPGEITHPEYVRRGVGDAAWSAPELVYGDGYMTSLAIDANGNLHVAVSTNGSSFLGYAKRTSEGWTREFVNNNSSATMPSMLLDAAGKPSIVFRDYSGYRLAQRAP